MADTISSWLGEVGRDLRHSLRAARRAPLATALIVAILAVTIGATTAIFSLVHVFFRDLPVRDPARLVEFVYQYPADPPMNRFGPDDYARARDANSSFTDVMGTAPAFVRGQQIVLPDSKDIPDTIAAEFVTGNYFSGLGVAAAVGRLLTADDDRPGAAPGTVVSWSYWRRTFNLDPHVLGATVQVLGTPVPIVGVADPRFEGVVVGYQPDVWLPVGVLPPARIALMLLARLRPGVTIARAQSEMRVIDRPRIERLGVNDPVWLSVKVDVTPARAGLSVPVTDQFARPVAALMALVTILLTLACANIGGLLLARGIAKQHDVAVRLSLGASRGRLARQMLVEAGVLAIGGAAAGVPLAAWMAPLLLRTMIAGTSGLHGPAVLDARVGVLVLAFTAGVTGLAALIFGAAPALGVRSTSPLAALKSGPRGARTVGRWSVGDGLVIAQVVLSFALSALLHLFGSHVWQLRGPALGFRPQPVLVLSVDTATGRPRESVGPLDAEALARLVSIPGVESAAVSAVTPISGAAGSRFISAEGFQEPRSARRRAWLNTVSEGYFATLGTPIVAGRTFQASDAGGGRVVVINQTLARHYFGGVSPLGRRVALDGEEQRPLEVIGVVADAKYLDVHLPAPPTIYFDYAQANQTPSQFTLRTSSAPSGAAADARRVLEGVFGAGRVIRITTLAAQVDASIVPERMMASLAGFFGAVGALLAAVGLYGLLAVAVARRTREIGVRMALGASTMSIVAVVVRKALTLVACGLVLGVPLAMWARHFAGGLIEHLTPDGWWPIAIAAIATAVVGVMGAALPARQAARVDPLTALRAD